MTTTVFGHIIRIFLWDQESLKYMKLEHDAKGPKKYVCILCTIWCLVWWPEEGVLWQSMNHSKWKEFSIFAIVVEKRLLQNWLAYGMYKKRYLWSYNWCVMTQSCVFSHHWMRSDYVCSYVSIWHQMHSIVSVGKKDDVAIMISGIKLATMLEVKENLILDS